MVGGYAGQYQEVLRETTGQESYTLPLQLQVSVDNVDDHVRLYIFLYTQLNNEYNAYTYNNHWLLMDIDLEHGNLTAWDSLDKPRSDYEEMIDMIQG